MNWQKQIAEFVATKKVNVSVETRLLDLVSEVGELAHEALRGGHYGRKEWQKTPEWSAELGDVMFSLICLANMTGVDLDRILSETLHKYESRVSSNGTS